MSASEVYLDDTWLCVCMLQPSLAFSGLADPFSWWGMEILM